MSKQARRFYAFGPFRLDPGQRVLLREGQAVPLTPKAAETLLVLVENAGHLVEKDELMRRVWPDAFVEEGNLSKNIYTLRKVLGQQDDVREHIETMSKRGYRFVAHVKEVGRESAEAPAHPQSQMRVREIRRLEKATAASVPESGPVALPAASESSLAPQLEPSAPGPVRCGVTEMPSRASDRAPGRTDGFPPAVVSARRWPRGKSEGLAWSLAAIGAVVGTGTYLYTHWHPSSKLTDRDTIVLADFTNTTGDPIFDGALRQGCRRNWSSRRF